MSRDSLELVFKHSGGVEVRSVVDGDEDDTVIWASDSDPDFMDAFGNEIMSGNTDAEKVLDWLEANDILTEEECGEAHVYDESLDGSEIKPDLDPDELPDDHVDDDYMDDDEETSY